MNSPGPHSRETPWQIWIDTGGTFTDCIALDPEGQIHRCKVLSSGALRDRIVTIGDTSELFLHGASALPPHFLEGFVLSPLGGGHGAKILHHDAARSSLRLATTAPEELKAGMAVELRSGEEAPLLATRLVTATPKGRTLPPVKMRLGTTRGTNALLERRGAPMVLFVTEGFEDLLPGSLRPSHQAPGASAGKGDRRFRTPGCRRNDSSTLGRSLPAWVDPKPVSRRYPLRRHRPPPRTPQPCS
ncbi:MAG: hypothetical protein K8R59_01870 [Thermoanaerobaculales bacterium]|nr:hypothetical protein [Thermoanaerobaculales bacterium]